MTYEELFSLKPYSLDKDEKKAIFDERLGELSRYHYRQSIPYRSVLDALGIDVQEDIPYDELPFLPVRLFKSNDFYSVHEEDLIKTMTSSGTSNTGTSRIYLDRETARDQTRALVRIVSSVLGNNRLPMLIIDSPNVIRDRTSFSARGAGILGFSMFGSKKSYALDKHMNLQLDAIHNFIEEQGDIPIFIFGFTWVIWKYFITELLKRGKSMDLSGSVLIHGGGWKKLQDSSVSWKEFREQIRAVTGITSVHDYYGMVEQTGSINVECEYGYLHSSNFSDIIIRDPKDFSIMENGKEGIVQTVSLLPKSYPGHSLLTEDLGTIHGVDDCSCGRKGTYFRISGRLQQAELRGCSNVIT